MPTPRIFQGLSFFTVSYNTHTNQQDKCRVLPCMLSIASTKRNRKWHDSLRLLKSVQSVQQFHILLLPSLWGPQSHPASWYSGPCLESQRRESEANSPFHQPPTLKLLARCLTPQSLRTVRTPGEAFLVVVLSVSRKTPRCISDQATGHVNIWRYMTSH